MCSQDWSNAAHSPVNQKAIVSRLPARYTHPRDGVLAQALEACQPPPKTLMISNPVQTLAKTTNGGQTQVKPL